MSAPRLTRSLPAFVLLAAGSVVIPALGRDPQPRSAAQSRSWRPDERQQPRHAERQTHRGFEVATGPITVVATTGREDAREVSRQALEAWNQMGQLADRFTSVHRSENFAQGAVQIVVERGPASSDQQRRVTVNPVNQATQILVMAGGRNDSLDQHLDEMRRHAAWALLRSAELDRQLPDWVCQGLAAFAGNGPAKAAAGADSAQLVTFLLTGNDGRHAAEFLGAVRQQAAVSGSSSEAENRRRNDPPPAGQANGGEVDSLAAELAAEFAAWQEDPQIGQPLWQPPADADSSVSDAQREMLFPLKLAARFAVARQPAAGTRITTFDKKKGASVVRLESATRPPPLRPLLDRVTHQEQPWATIGPDGELIWSSETDKLERLLGVDDGRYQYAWHQGHWALETTLDGGTLRGWLEPNAEQPGRPVARFWSSADQGE